MREQARAGAATLDRACRQRCLMYRLATAAGQLGTDDAAHDEARRDYSSSYVTSSPSGRSVPPHAWQSSPGSITCSVRGR